MIRIITNDEESGDWVIVIKDEKIIYQGHSFNIYDIAKFLGVEVESVDDDSVFNLQHQFEENR